MDIERVIKKIRDIKEAAPTNSSGANGFTNAAGTGPVAGYDKRLFGVTDDLLSQDYQTPDESGLAMYRFSNVYPVEKLSEKDIDNMVSASKEYDELVDEQRFGRRDYMKEKLQRVIDAFRSLKEDKIINDGKKLVNPKKNPLITKEESNPRIPRKKGQPANSKKHSDLYTDENPKGTIHGLGFKNVATAKASVSKIRNSSRSHAHKIQAAVAMEQRAREMGKTSEAAVYRKYINSMKKKTKKMNEAANPAQQAAIAIDMKKKGIKPKNLKEQITFPQMQQRVRDAKERRREQQKKSEKLYMDTKKKGVKFYDKKGTGRLKDGKKIYD